MAASVETSEYTSAYERQLSYKIGGVAQQKEKLLEYIFTKKSLFGFVSEQEQNTQGIPFSLLDYIELVDWSGRIIREDKRGAISGSRPRLLSTLGLDDDTWLSLASRFGKDYHGAVGSLEALAAYASHTGKRWIASKNQLRRPH
ncbi:hypothetical protein [uncultured Psychromonas sp.]|uniref:hypothetical protein n=1 Tax=uncultured Psychromonas sp. TaxID=173974 RepID=UPI0026216240|nr:hypothetical protein [uncultured Psychromonas sp.]